VSAPTTTAPSSGWAQFPTPAPAAHTEPAAVGVVVATALVGAPALVRVLTTGPHPRWGAAAVLLAAAVAVGTRRGGHDDRWWVAATLVVAGVGSRSAALSLVLGVLVLRRLVGPSSSWSVERLGPFLLPTALAAWWSTTPHRPSGGLVVQGLVLAVLIAAPGPVERATAVLGRWVGRGVEAAGRLVALVLGLAVWVPVVGVPWLVSRLLRVDPLRAVRPRGTRFVPRHVQLTDTTRTWIPPTSLLGGGWRAAGANVVRVAVVVALAVVVPRTVSALGTRLDEVPVALAGSTWWSDARRAQHEVFSDADWSAYLGPTLPELRTPHTNVVDGRRVTWRPPAPPEATVWLFGGSTMFGLGQRDDHTVASALARAAWERGVALEVVNFGVHGDVHWMEQRRLRSALTGGAAPPDVAVFYDGWNDLYAMEDFNAQGRAAQYPYRGMADTVVLPDWDRLRRFTRFLNGTGVGAPGPATTVLPPAALVDHALRQYRASVAETRRELEAAGIVGRFFLQPTRATRDRAVAGEGVDSPEWRRQVATFNAGAPAGVVDLTAVFDDHRIPIYWDGGHTNEAGAQLVAEAMLDEVLAATEEAGR